ncbi:hypothetical protein [Aestuariivirga litoralis]|uniref:hypothetical protein n=1 Tax=Aestuariivirga litoralis TaxID=2650924 RepID=UPI0018C48F61|nr:hypothetical protein [Aestuariivirga litoralis]MBG1231025.1 hypothetical protein [Aestuariivirga litoralis]
MNTKIALISALAPVSIALAFTFAAPAQAKSLSDACYSGSKAKTVSCCNAWVKNNGLPIWMGGQNSCQAAAGCIGGGKQQFATRAAVVIKKKCYIAIIDTNNPNDDNTPPASRGRGNGNGKR